MSFIQAFRGHTPLEFVVQKQSPGWMNMKLPFTHRGFPFKVSESSGECHPWPQAGPSPGPVPKFSTNNYSGRNPCSSTPDRDWQPPSKPQADSCPTASHSIPHSQGETCWLPENYVPYPTKGLWSSINSQHFGAHLCVAGVILST